MSKEIGARIRLLREKRNLTQSELGREFNISDAGVSAWEVNGVRQKSLLKKIAEYFGVSIDYLKEGSTALPGDNSNRSNINNNSASGNNITHTTGGSSGSSELDYLRQRVRELEEQNRELMARIFKMIDKQD